MGAFALTAIAALSACSSSTADGSDGGSGTAARTGSVSAAPPGKYQTLPEPCGSVSQDTLHDLLPGASDYSGQSALTYDTDRVVGCKWSGVLSGQERRLHVTLERVVSYDPAVSDEDKAEQDYEQRASAAHIPDAIPSTSTSASTSTSTSAPPSASGPSPAPSDSPSTRPSSSPSGAAGPSASSGGPGADDADTAPRRVGGIGDEAYLNDVLTAEDSGVRREVTIVFRESNVLVTVVLSQSSTDKTQVPSSGPLQLGADDVAHELAKKIEEAE
ncbi:hypothetical protein CK485_05495 [Streptomyces sp. ICBB 8177]|nr:hypothetical protein CK485_05495 [Streptomyces sp. ICBB 8177]